MKNKFIFLFFLLLGCSPVKDREYLEDLYRNMESPVAGQGMVVSAHPLASRVGIDILKKGGNAIDASIALQFALAVTYPVAGNIGGGGFMVIRTENGEYNALDYREKAPMGAHRDMYLDENDEVIENLSTRGHLAPGVPGSVAGMVKAWEKYGRLPWTELVQPAVNLAKNGFPLTENQAEGLNRRIDEILDTSTIKPEFLDRAWREGDTIYWSDLARTLERIRDYKREGFYKGMTADLIVEEMERGRGIITHEDLEQYEAKWRDPIIHPYKSYNIISMSPPSSGGVALAQLFTMVEPYPIARWGWNEVRTVHLMVEAERRVYADRATHLGDPDYYDVPVEGLIDSLYLAERMNDFTPDKITPSDAVASGTPAAAEGVQTTHFSVVDPAGNAVAVTTTLNTGYGSKVFVAGAGFILNNIMDDFSIKPGVPNYYGLIGGEANAIEPGKRMLSSMTPTIVEKNGELFMVVGTPGGSTIITSVFQTILNVVEHGFTMQGAVSAPRFHHQWDPEYIKYEPDALDPQTIKKLTEKGHTFYNTDAMGRVDAILVRPDGTLEGGADPRGDDMAEVY